MKKKIVRIIRRCMNSVTVGILGFLIIALVLISTSIYNTRLSEKSADESVHAISEFYLKELGERRSFTIHTRIKQIEENLMHAFEIAKDRRLKNQSELRAFLEEIRELYGYERVAVVDEQKLLYTAHATMSGVSRYSFLSDEITKPRVYTMNLYRAHKQVILVVPLKGMRVGSNTLKIAFIRINLSAILNEIISQTDDTETVSKVYYNNGQNMVKVDEKEEDNILQMLKDSEFVDNHSYTDLNDDFYECKTGFTSYKSGDAINYMYYTPVEGTKWIYAVTIRESSISNNVSSIKDSMLVRNNLQIITIIVVMIIAFTMFILYSRRMEREEKRHLVKLSQTDAMTGIYNRGGGERMISEAIDAKAEGLFILLDADKFKSVNDNYGHDVGDKVIISIADALKSSFRDDDIVMRLGGDEFAVYAPGVCDSDAASHVIRRFFKAIDAIEIPEMENRKICVSLGACFWLVSDPIHFENLYKRADAMLYDSKQVEGNHVEYWKK
ncbi:MAG TPA: hypothetical protein DCP06_02525 [Lachnospiraceae bacterium]|nr:hypothetical protein [Lachnospiraceae bacterium]